MLPPIHRSLPLAIILMILAVPLAQAQEHFTDCVDNGINTTVIVPDTVAASLGDGVDLETGDEIALYAEDGSCAGIGIWEEGSNMSIAVFDNSGPTESGYVNGELLKYRVWDASADIEYDAGSDGVAYVECGGGSTNICRDDGAYEVDKMFRVAELDASDGLPVEMSSIEARADGNQALLEWTTVTETNNAGFEVQYQRADAASWKTLDFVEGHGTTSKPQTYRYETDALSFGSHQFRLKQVDFDGVFEYSETVEVALRLTDTYKLSEAYPNPFQNRANVRLTVAEAQDVNVAVYNTLGQRVAVLHQGPLSPNETHEFSLNGQRMPSGLYFVRAQGESFAATRRVTHVK